MERKCEDCNNSVKYPNKSGLCPTCYQYWLRPLNWGKVVIVTRPLSQYGRPDRGDEQLRAEQLKAW